MKPAAPPSPPQAEELCAATLRALTGDPELQRCGHEWRRGAHRLQLRAPHQRPGDGSAGFSEFADLRAGVDGLALRLRHSNAETHSRFLPAKPVARLVFELLEQLRVESLAPDAMPGMSANLRRRFAVWAQEFEQSGLTETDTGILLYTVARICWSRLNGHALPAEAEDLIETTRAGIAPMLGVPLAAMRRWRGDQQRFACHALELAHLVGAAAGDDDRIARHGPAENAKPYRQRFALLLDFSAAADGAGGAGATARTTDGECETGYRVFTRRFDTEIEPALRVRKALLREYRERLDARMARAGVNPARLARMLVASLASARRDGWRFGEEEGRLDGRRLAAFVAAPGARDLFMREQRRPRSDAVVGFLVDCSGSMKERIEEIALVVDVLVRAGGMAGISTEVLGFTTGAWNGGRAQAEWLRRGRPAAPGRLNEACHLVFKRADASWRRSRESIAALLKLDLFREGIAGEALDWACRRLLRHDARHRILIVLSDGCATDSATALANGTAYLDDHLREVAGRREREGAVRVIGAGVGAGHDLSGFFRDCLTADLAAPGGIRLACLELARRITGRRNAA